MYTEISKDERIDKINEDIKIIQRKSGLTFGTDSYLLSAFAKRMSRENAADLGCGTGVCSLLCQSKSKYKKIFALEIQESFASLTARNARLNGMEDVIFPICCDIRNASDHIESGTLGVVISNPPYVKTGCGKAPCHDEMNTARREENGTIEDFCASASLLLRHGGYFTCVFRPDRTAELISALKNAFLEPKRMIFVYPDKNSPPCLLLTEAKKGAAPSVNISRPLIIYNGQDKNGERKYTEDMDRVYSEFSLDFLFSKGG